jgi:hypothetical protein
VLAVEERQRREVFVLCKHDLGRQEVAVEAGILGAVPPARGAAQAQPVAGLCGAPRTGISAAFG